MNFLFDLPRPFFPNPVFAWVWLALLMTAAGVAAYTDTKRAKVPNLLVVLTLIAGLLMNVVRGAWNAAANQAGADPLHKSWLFGTTDSLWLGGLDGLLFGLAGFLIGFGVFFLVWMFGLIGGGDVKLFAALGGWLGMLHLGMAWVLSVGVLILWALAKLMTVGFRPKKMQSAIRQLQKAEDVAREAAAKPGGSKKLRVTYSLPIAVAVLLLSLWSHRVELRLVPPKPVPTPNTTGANPNDPPSPQPTK